MLSAASLRPTDPRDGAGAAALVRSLAAVASAVAPLLGGVVAVVILANVAQTGLSFNAGRLAPRGAC